MLVLTRNEEQSIIIGDKLIIIKILGINGRQVKIGIDAPKEIPVHREEIYQAILADKEKAAAEAA